MAFTDKDIDYLTAHSTLIDEVTAELALTKKSMLADHTILRTHFGTYARAVTELVVARRSAVDKFPACWLTDSDAAQQATPAAVAEHRAAHLQAAGVRFVHDVTCSIGTEAPSIRGRGMDWLGSDLNTQRLRMARHNLGEDAWLVRADALGRTSHADVIVADPARRAEGRRITDPAQLIPPLPELLATYAESELAIKCAPGIDYSGWEGLVNVVSVDGAVKETCLYTPGLSAGARREATMLGARHEVVTDLDSAEVDVRGPGRYIIEPDGAVIRAGLVRGWAARHGLWMLDRHIAFLSGENIPEGWSGFPFIEEVSLKKLRSALHAHEAGSLEILVRGVDINPDQLRKKMKLKGKRAMAVVVARIGDTATAYLCGARQWAGSVPPQLSG
ncbi:THUMP-like domain-containing protein [Corynebacterium cystitidis]|uniref:THUMP-like domain-containing protein n=1 Tax=Corynebacterium cystitidis TaxID=35757 RepID=UPI00211DF7FA|nr:SAM-dependent methyltransferase [Corynebacterium cystitidis]